MTHEQWRPIPGYVGRYDASSAGRIRSWVTPRGRQLSHVARTLRPYMNRRGYATLTISARHGKTKGERVHRLILSAFAGQCPKGMQAAHLAGDPSNNSLENLAWVTPKENQAHRVRHGTHNRGERNENARLKDADVRLMRIMRVDGIPTADIAARFGIVSAAVLNICQRKGWPHVV